jgi:Hg(II)-responsive transcriptional regulator
MTIGTVAEKAGVGVETIRYYQRRGLIIEPPKRSSAFRQYPEDTVARLRFIKRAQHLGFSLKEIEELLSLRLSGGASRQDVRARAEAKIDELDDKIKALRDMKKALKGLTASCCADRGNESDCPILEALDEG